MLVILLRVLCTMASLSCFLATYSLVTAQLSSSSFTLPAPLLLLTVAHLLQCVRPDSVSSSLPYALPCLTYRARPVPVFAELTERCVRCDSTGCCCFPGFLSSPVPPPTYILRERPFVYHHLHRGNLLSLIDGYVKWKAKGAKFCL